MTELGIKVSKKELKEWMVEHIVKGDSGDGVPNIFSADDVFITEERQKSVSSKRLAEFMERGFDACRDDAERRNWHRNATLVDFAYIPEDIKKIILDEYEKPSVGDKNSVMNYLIKNKCRMLLNEIEDF